VAWYGPPCPFPTTRTLRSFAPAWPQGRAGGPAAGAPATLVRAPAALRAKVDVFEPEPAVLAALTARVREGFDPRGVLNPGRMWAGV
jgi:FAD/FMN-containing dehydrogenase